MADELSKPLGPRRRVTLKDVAMASDVSLASASYAVNGTGSLGEGVRARILKIAEDLGYRQNLSARAMRTGKTGAIGLVVPDFNNPFFTSLAQAVMRQARQAGYCVIVIDTEESEALEREAFKRLIDRGVDGVVWFPVRDVNTVEAQIRSLPAVLIDRYIDGLEAVRADYFGGGKQAAKHLLGLGHKDIGIITGPMHLKSQQERIAGAKAAFEASGVKPAFCVSNAFAIDLDAHVAEAVLSRKATAIYVGTDLIALGVLKCAQTHGLRVPEDLSVIGFGDIPWAQWSNPPLTTVELPIEDMASEAFTHLLKRIDATGDSLPGVFDTRLILRASTSRAG
jgi:LacI family transcriptional regulator